MEEASARQEPRGRNGEELATRARPVVKLTDRAAHVLHLLHERSVIFVVRSPQLLRARVNSSWEIQRARSFAQDRLSRWQEEAPGR